LTAAPPHEHAHLQAPNAHLLLVHDEPRMLDSLHELLLARGYALTKAANGREAIDRMRERDFDLVILDLNLPAADGHAVMDHIGTLAKPVQMVIVSGSAEIDAAIGYFRRGACDFLRRPFSREMLFRTVDTALHERGGNAEDRRAQARDRTHHLAYHDQLTGLPNRALFNDRLGLAMRQADRNASGLAVLFLDLDRFRHINDTLGHAAGDGLLQQVALRLGACLRSCDTLSRRGGDEFTVVLPELKEQNDAAHIAGKLVHCVRPSFRVAGKPLNISASVGIASYPQDGKTADELIANADVAMYKVKARGKNGHAFFAHSVSNMRLT
jgi:diguanylate cyclase (GGDEF)-like protein